ncbi:hypothetical protein BH10PSE19_BH10PSE19_15740 [soil metagenome]
MRFLRYFIQDPRYLAAIISLLLTVIVFSHHQPLNLDGIVYLNAAETLLNQGLKAAMAVYAWPLYPLLIAGVSLSSHLSLLTSAYLLNTLFATLIVLTFITLCKELGGSRIAQYLAALVILIYPYLNHYRDEVIRDYGYYAFALLSLLQLIRFLRTPKWRHALAWGLTISIASLFRIEGIVMQLLVPIVVLIPWLSISTSRIKLFCQLNSLTFLLILLGSIWLLTSHHHTLELGRISEVLDYGLQFMAGIRNKFTILQNNLFNTFGTKAIPSFFWGGVFALFIFYFLNACGILYTALAAFAWRYKLMPAAQTSQFAMATYCIINLLILAVFAIQQLFLTGRYLALLCLLVMLYAPFTLEYLLSPFFQAKKIANQKHKWLLTLVALWLLVISIDSTIHPGPSKAYLVTAGTWLAKNTAIESRVYSNDAQLMYYSKRLGLKYPKDYLEGKVPFSTLVNQPWQDYDYLALVISRKQPEEANKILALLKSPPLCTFVNKHGDKAMVFKLQKGNQNYVYSKIRN